MTLNFKFAIISDLHIALPHTIWDAPNRFHLVEVSIPAFEQILASLIADQPDFLLLPGDLVQHGERENHEWLANRLAQLPFPVYVVPGNHDVVHQGGNLPGDDAKCDRITLADFPKIYQRFGYTDAQQLDYQHEILPGVHLIGLSVLSGSHMELVEAIHAELAEMGLGKVPLVIGGIIPEEDAEALRGKGLKAVFTPKDVDMNKIMDRMVSIIRENNGLESAA